MAAYNSLPYAAWAESSESTSADGGLLARFTSALFGAAPSDKPVEPAAAPVRPIQVRRQSHKAGAASTSTASQAPTTPVKQHAASSSAAASHRNSPPRAASTYSGAPGPRPRLLSVAAAPSVHLSDAGSGRAEMTAALPSGGRAEMAVASPALAESIGSHLGHSLPPHTIQGFPILSRDTLNDDARSVSSFGGGGSDRPDLATLFRRARHEGLVSRSDYAQSR